MEVYQPDIKTDLKKCIFKFNDEEKELIKKLIENTNSFIADNNTIKTVYSDPDKPGSDILDSSCDQSRGINWTFLEI